MCAYFFMQRSSSSPTTTTKKIIAAEIESTVKWKWPWTIWYCSMSLGFDLQLVHTDSSVFMYFFYKKQSERCDCVTIIGRGRKGVATSTTNQGVHFHSSNRFPAPTTEEGRERYIGLVIRKSSVILFVCFPSELFFPKRLIQSTILSSHNVRSLNYTEYLQPEKENKERSVFSMSVFVHCWRTCHPSIPAMHQGIYIYIYTCLSHYFVQEQPFSKSCSRRRFIFGYLRNRRWWCRTVTIYHHYFVYCCFRW